MLVDIVLDTNVLASNFSLRTRDLALLINYLRKTGSRLVLPQLVIEELPAVLERELQETVNKYKRIQREFDRLATRIKPPPAVQRRINKFTASLEAFANRPYVKVVPYRPEFLAEVIQRSIHRRKPCSATGEEFRDAIIWMSLLDHLRQSRSDAVFISQNKSEFANDTGDNLHPQLQQEVSLLGGKVAYFSSLKDFLKTVAVPNTNISFEWLTEALSSDEVVRLTLQSFTGCDLLGRIQADLERRWPSLPAKVVGVEPRRDAAASLESFYAWDLMDGGLEVHAMYLLEMDWNILLDEWQSHRGYDTLHRTYAFSVRVATTFHTGSVDSFVILDAESSHLGTIVNWENYEG